MRLLLISMLVLVFGAWQPAPAARAASPGFSSIADPPDDDDKGKSKDDDKKKSKDDDKKKSKDDDKKKSKSGGKKKGKSGGTKGDGIQGGDDRVYYVRKSGDDRADGLSPETAFRTVQRGVEQCTADDCMVIVGPGVYHETVWIGLQGGSAAASGTASKPNSIVGDPTGELTGDDPEDVEIAGGTYAVYLNNRDYWQFDDITISASASYAVYAYRCDGLTIRDCIIDVPRSIGVYVYGGGATTIVDNRFRRDRQSGHNLYLYNWNGQGGDIDVSGNCFALTGADYGSSGFSQGQARLGYDYGVIVLDYASGSHKITITNNLVSDCYLPIYLYSYNSNVQASVSNNTVTHGLYSYYLYVPSGSLDASNNIEQDCYYGMYAYARARGYLRGLASYRITRSLGRYFFGEEGVIETDPQLVDPAGGDWGLAQGSPAIDAGYADGAPGIDYRGSARPFDGDGDGTPEFDLGAIEYGGQPTPTALRVIQWRETDPSQ